MVGRTCGVVLSVLVVSGAAAAQDSTEVAREHFDAGTRAFDTGDYERAASEFQRAYELTRHPDLLFNVYSSAERAGQLEQAASALERFLAEGELEAERRPALEQRLERLRERIAARAAGEPETPPDHQEAPPEVAPTPAPVVESSGVHPAAIGTLVAAGVLAAGFVVLAALSEVEDGALAARCGRDTTRTCTNDEVATLLALDVAADVSWIAAALAGALGVVLLFTLPAEPSGSARATIAPWASPDGAGLAATGRF